jgi:antitoxin component HigA of HigAB toxin-antitoxin module
MRSSMFQTMLQSWRSIHQGNPSVASEVLSGKRELSKENIRRLADRFSIPADMLL